MLVKSNYIVVKVDIKKSKNKKGILIPFHFLDSLNRDNRLPIKIKRIFVIKNLKKGDIRGEHALLETQQIMFVLNGAIKLKLFDGKAGKVFILKTPTRGVLVKPLVWRTFEVLKNGTIVLVFCDREHNKKEYIRNYESFIQQTRK